MHDTLADGRAVRILTVLDVYGREGPAPQKLDHFAVEELTESAVL
jgi:hypothetical protein